MASGYNISIIDAIGKMFLYSFHNIFKQESNFVSKTRPSSLVFIKHYAIFLARPWFICINIYLKSLESIEYYIFGIYFEIKMIFFNF